MPDLAYTSVSKIFAIAPMVGSLTSLDSSQLFQYAEYAEALVNGTIVKHYTLPISDSVPLLEAIATDITIHDVLVKHVFTRERLKDSVWPDRFKRSMKMLDSIADGKTLLVNSAGTLIGARTDVAQIKTNQMDYQPTMTELPEEDQVQDEDKTDGS